MDLTSDPTILEWFLKLPLTVAIILAACYGIMRSAQWWLEYLAAKDSRDPQEALRADLMKAHQDVRKEVQELRAELAEAYDKMRKLSQELHRMREHLAGFRYELQLLKAEHPTAEPVISAALRKLENLDHPIEML